VAARLRPLLLMPKIASDMGSAPGREGRAVYFATGFANPVGGEWAAAFLSTAMRRKATQRTHQPLANLANRQHGVVSIRQLTGSLGYSESAVNRAARAGRLHRLHRGVYAVGHRRISRQGECLAAVLAAGTGSLLSHNSAAWLWGLRAHTPRPLTVTTPNTPLPKASDPPPPRAAAH
jgi:putative AbiEi antitoxin of type IV toxin-antitoxin system